MTREVSGGWMHTEHTGYVPPVDHNTLVAPENQHRMLFSLVLPVLIGQHPWIWPPAAFPAQVAGRVNLFRKMDNVCIHPDG
jgi:hypothetical protein